MAKKHSPAFERCQYSCCGSGTDCQWIPRKQTVFPRPSPEAALMGSCQCHSKSRRNTAGCLLRCLPMIPDWPVPLRLGQFESTTTRTEIISRCWGDDLVQVGEPMPCGFGTGPRHSVTSSDSLTATIPGHSTSSTGHVHPCESSSPRLGHGKQTQGQLC